MERHQAHDSRRAPPRRRRACHIERMTSKALGFTTAVFFGNAVLLLAFGAAMWSEAPTEADAAVGKGLLAISMALGVTAFALTCAWLTSLGYPRSTPSPVRSTSDTA